MVRIIPDIPKIRARWAHRASEIPDWLEVPMSDGTVIEYYPKIEQPAFRKAIEGVRRMAVGYEKPADEATSNRPIRNETTNSIPPRRRRSNGGGLKNDRP